MHACIPVGVAAVVKIAMYIVECKPCLFCLIVIFHSGFGLTDSYWIVPFYTLRRQVPMRQVEMWLYGTHWGSHFPGKMGTQGPHFHGGPQNFMTDAILALIFNFDPSKSGGATALPAPMVVTPLKFTNAFTSL